MSHQSVLNIIRDTAKSLADNMQFGYGLDNDFDVDQDKSYPFIWLDPLRARPEYTVNNTENYQKSWNVRMLFYNIDYKDSIPEQYELILSTTDKLVDKFIQNLNVYDDLTLTAITQDPFIKATSDILTGWIVTFNITVPDDFEYCIDLI